MGYSIDICLLTGFHHGIVTKTSTIQRALRMHVISVYFHLNLWKLYDGPIRLLSDVAIQVESIARGCWMVPLMSFLRADSLQTPRDCV